MKLLRLSSVALALVMLTTVACKDEFLDVAPTASLGEVELSSDAGMDGSLIGAYAMLTGRGGFYSDMGNWFWGDVRGGDANKGSNDGDQAQVNEIMRYGAQATNGSIAEKYNRLMEGVARSNATIKLTDNPAPGSSAATVARVRGEALFLRGLYYFDLKKIFNDVPYVTESWDEVTPIPNNVNLYDSIARDFSAAAELLVDDAPDAGRANKWAAKAFLGKVLLFSGDAAGAKAQFDEVIADGMNANGTSYALVDDMSTLFRVATENNSENIFSIQAAANTGDVANANPGLVLNFPHGPTSGPATCCGFNQPSIDLANSFRTTSAGLPVAYGTWNDAGNAIANDLGIGADAAFTVDAGPVDPRIDIAMGRRGIPYLGWGPHGGASWIRDQGFAGPYSPKKYVYDNGAGEEDLTSWTPGYTGVNQYLMRYADLLLLAAEAEITLGNVQAGVDLINQVRARAANISIDGSPANYVISQYGSLSAADALDAIRLERRLELAGEGHRVFDLVRWGIFETEIARYIANDGATMPGLLVGAAANLGPEDIYMPIPQAEIDLQGTDVIAQNPGY